MNTPNKLTMLRILMIPAFIVFASVQAIPYNYLIAAVIFSVASFTDFLDGHIARKQNIVTDFGKFADPLADKILTTTAFVYMMMDGVCHPLVLVIILTREFAVSGVRMVAAGAPGGKVIAANIWGKVKTVVQMVTIILYYFLVGFGQLWPSFFGPFAGAIRLVTLVLCWVVALVTAVSGVQYIWGNRQYINTAK
ncbi:CDP-diacylglycerol--glycerol-3-phosphate 3-phosphatidyltransferase [Ruminococcaceae bacterium OttesenSCG-928-A11]|nr:CDP-diacylglycerol--glycerol-3-phosphate 3-phosphatidyltransferase [Ruminococcaceae bacterium OttesenSCG-928-A11]